MQTRTGFLISQIKLTQGRVFQKLLNKYNIEEFNGPQGNILYILWQTENIPIKDLVKKTGLAKNTLTSMLERMEEKGLIGKKIDEKDKRKTRIFLTSKAINLKEQYDHISDEMNKIFFKGFTENEIRILESYLDRLIDNLDIELKNTTDGEEV